ncbi:lytic transglycosylase domain-containing protein [Alkalibacillus haloalkaliphilus]|uniref:lytic transglycosylase domain-containing protein n=1 Tax=Alkalibacillus haloalkaliphilus TaxID=94136 RepID=UPI002935C423|nr:transglycosylase SLT domain-containing protein [Alkalibacillus haloalkaliphilus]MDV2581002.1 transglycosylase SLT domain-containing protein [Alkalibacillus haloalkaliphilus]
MNIKHYAILFITIMVMTTAFIVNNINYEQTIEELEQQQEELKIQNESIQNQNEYFQSINLKWESDFSYHNWNEIEMQANKMVEDSEGSFEKSWALFLIQKSEAYDIDPFIVYELIKVETGDTFDPELVGPPTQYGHAYGLSQFMENTAPWIADMAELPYEKDLLFEPTYSIQLAVVYLDFLYDEYNNWDEALTAYHRGIGGLEQYQEENGHAASWYAVEIQEKAEENRSLAFAN